jgi:uncharacterized membrane protein
VNKGRVEAFSDGVFAIAITLLVLTIAQPRDYSRLAAELRSRWPSLAAYVVSFLVIGIMWVNHHTVFSNVKRIDRGFYYRNLVLLMTIVFIPYPTEVFGVALGHSSSAAARTAAVFYSLTMTVNACAWAALWLHASRRRRLLSDEFPEDQRRISTVLFTGGTLVYLVSVGVALLSPFLCLAFHGVLAVFYACDPIARRIERDQAG